MLPDWFITEYPEKEHTHKSEPGSSGSSNTKPGNDIITGSWKNLLYFQSLEITPAEILYLTRSQNQYHIPAKPFVTATSHIIHTELVSVGPASPTSPRHKVSPLWHISYVIYLFSPRYAKKKICIPQSGWQGVLISPEGLWKGSDSAWKEDSKGNLCDISCHVNRHSSEQRLTAQLLAANPMMPGEVLAAESNKVDSSCSSVNAETVELPWALNYLQQAGGPRLWHCQTANVNCVRSVKLEERCGNATVFC